MSHYSYWRLMEDIPISDPEGLFAFLEAVKKDEHMSAMARPVRWDVSETVTRNSLTEKITHKDYWFYGLYPEFDISREHNWDNGDYGINHFSPDFHANNHAERDMKFIGDLSAFMGKDLQFLVFEEGWPTLDPGYAFLVTAMKGEVVITPLRLAPPGD